MHAHAGPPPAAFDGAEVVGSLDGLVDQVKADPSFW
jgi:hypothetical protein